MNHSSALRPLDLTATTKSSLLPHPWEELPLLRRWTVAFAMDPPLRRIWAHARRLLRGEPTVQDIAAAASLFHIYNMQEEAAAILAHFGLLDQAARIYLDLQRPDAAALVYAGAAQWEQASFHYAQAKQWQNAGFCAMNHRDFSAAAQFFMEDGLLAEAALCMAKAGDFARAVHLYLKVGDLEHAVMAFTQWRVVEKEEVLQAKLDAADREMLLCHGVAMPLQADIKEDQVESEQATRLMLVPTPSMDEARAGVFHSVSPALTTVASAEAKNVSPLAVRETARSVVHRASEPVTSPAAATSHALARISDNPPAPAALTMSQPAGSVNTPAALTMSQPAGSVNTPAALTMSQPAKSVNTPAALTMSQPAGSVNTPAALTMSQPAKSVNTPAALTTSQPAKSVNPPLTVTAGAPAVITNDSDLGEYRPSWLTTAPQLRQAAGPLELAQFFERFSAEGREQLWSLGQVRSCHAGQVLVDFDEEPLGLYTVLEGHLALFKDRSVGAKPADRIGARISFGQFWSVMRLRSQVRVEAEQPTKIHMIRRSDLLQALRVTTGKGESLRQTFVDVLREHLLASIVLKNA